MFRFPVCFNTLSIPTKMEEHRHLEAMKNKKIGSSSLSLKSPQS